jgi:cytochrome oxidase Cu insertion factor (SCO1/SenC/PrrC family)
VTRAGRALATPILAFAVVAAPAFAEPGTPASGAPGARPPLGHADTNYTYAIGGFAPDYEVPSPGTYELPPIDTVSDHPLVDAEGRATTLRAVLAGRFAVVSFIYATCGEATGCPMSTEVLRRLDRRLTTMKLLSDDVALVTVSFDPARDTPERLVEMQKLRSPGSTWRFYTAKDEAALAPMLDDFGQQIARLHYPDGTWTGVFRHVLKVYLLDREQRVRNVYSVGFLNPELVLADLETLKLEEKPR